MSSYSQKARGAARRLRSRLAGAREAELEAELRATKRKLRNARAELRRTRAQLASGLPPRVEETIARARAEHLTYLKPDNLRELASVVIELERAGRPGLIIEAGTARGGSAIVLAAAKVPERPMKVYDVFGMIPPPTERDGEDVHERYEKIAGGAARGVGGDTYYGYRDDLYREVTESFSRLGVPVGEHNVELIKGLFEDTIELDEPVAFAHLDGDWYESTMTCLTRIAPLLVPGGRIVLDDYNKWSGCRAAVDEYFADRDGFRLEQRAKLHVIRD
ncbi:MAG TPA: TylF/MycF/NovP-related O-methyltransferase [Solirubrobacteraceae bacterium]|nr:TylF/MycF/NovP-related O-methyltransferase [Solirubrobacteraceae bacterium]